MTDPTPHGWSSDFPTFHESTVAGIRERLQAYVADAGPSQIRAWVDSIPALQQEVGEVMAADSNAGRYSTILEYQLPMESRRPDVIVLAKGTVIVLELKGKSEPSLADIDQVAAYARDLKCYHRECDGRPVIPVVVPMRARGVVGMDGNVRILGPDTLDRFLVDLDSADSQDEVSRDRFLDEDAYRPLPTLVKAARELFHSGTLRSIHRAKAATDPAVEAITSIIHEAARTQTRHLVLLTGVPGAGKTLVGLRIAHAHFLDDLAVDRGTGKPTAPAVFLSGNGPLVEVLQYELRGGGGAGKTFVRGVFDYVKTYSRGRKAVPPEHVLVFDEAQRAFDAEQVRDKHANTAGFEGGKSEPEHFIEFADRIPKWCVVIGLIGSGQEIHVGEEAGVGQWRDAVAGARDPAEWKVHGPAEVRLAMEDGPVAFHANDRLSLDTEIRFHLATDLHAFVAGLLDHADAEVNRALALQLESQGYHLRITRSLETAAGYLKERYAEHPDARYGLLASSKDKDLVRFGVKNDFPSTKALKFGPWYGEPESDPLGRSCRCLRDCVTEFGAQGLELDAVLLAWGTDLASRNGAWSTACARGYKKGARVKNPFQLRLNAYRVLLTRGRDGVVMFLPPIPWLDETFQYLCASGFREI